MVNLYWQLGIGPFVVVVVVVVVEAEGLFEGGGHEGGVVDVVVAGVGEPVVVAGGDLGGVVAGLAVAVVDGVDTAGSVVGTSVGMYHTVGHLVQVGTVAAAGVYQVAGVVVAAAELEVVDGVGVEGRVLRGLDVPEGVEVGAVAVLVAVPRTRLSGRLCFRS